MTVIQAGPEGLLVKNASELCVPVEPQTVERRAGWSLYIQDDRIAWMGPESQAPDVPQAKVLDAQGGAVLPALVDSHTHLVFGGARVEDFSRRARGLSYAEIAAEGGGILTTVKATREASDEALTARAERLLVARQAYGIGTTEIKSGYGLTVEHELRMLKVARALAARGWDVETTLLAAHAVPKDIPRETYLKQIIEEMLPAAKAQGLCRFVDAFVEKGAYTVAEARAVFEAAKRHGMVPRVHADQITAGGGAELAAEVGAASADHIENISDAGLQAMAQAKVVGTLLPGAMTYLGDSCPGLGRRLVDAGVKVAVATDMNPGSSPTQNLPLMATLAVTQMGLTAEEALYAITKGGAVALQRDDVGRLEVGARGRLIVLNDADSRALISAFGEPIIHRALTGA